MFKTDMSQKKKGTTHTQTPVYIDCKNKENTTKNQNKNKKETESK